MVKKSFTGGVLFVAFLLLPALIVLSRQADTVFAASPGDIVINEIMYNQPGSLEDAEFLELHNTTTTRISLSGWCFNQGITLKTTASNPACFPENTTIEAGGFVLVSPDLARTLAIYGKSAVASYATTNLSNGGEAVGLVDDTGEQIDVVNYDDISPWPTSPDGDGPSLELKNPLADNSLATSWGASSGSPTPGLRNSISGLDAPIINNVSDPNGVSANQAVQITANVANADNASVSYRINFGAEITVPMFDDATNGDDQPNDGRYTANIPGQTQGILVRFKVSANSAYGASTSPGNDESMKYHGYMVKDPSIISVEPVLQWFIEDANYNQMQTNVSGETRYPCVVVYGDDVYDNSEVRLKGNNTLSLPKHNYKFYLPSGSAFKPAGAEQSVDEFHFNADYLSEQIAKVPTVWWVGKQVGIPVPDVVTMRLQRNGQFEGAYNYIDKFEGNWRKANGLNDGQFFEDYGEIVNGADNLNDLYAWAEAMKGDSTSQETRDYVLDNNNIPNLISATVFPAVAGHLDHTIDHNLMTYKDNNTGRWSVLHWDFDMALNLGLAGPKTLVSPYDTFSGQDGLRWYLTAVYDQPDLRRTYFRRLRSVADELYASNTLLNKYTELTSRHAELTALDNQKWPSDARHQKSSDIETIKRIQETLFVYFSFNGVLPASQTDDERRQVSISEVVSSDNNSEEYIKISNSANTPVDISDWVIEGINYTLQKGAVVPANGSMYLLRDDKAYRASHKSVLVAGQYTNDLGGSGRLVIKTNSGMVIDDYDY